MKSHLITVTRYLCNEGGQNELYAIQTPDDISDYGLKQEIIKWHYILEALDDVPLIETDDKKVLFETLKEHFNNYIPAEYNADEIAKMIIDLNIFEGYYPFSPFFEEGRNFDTIIQYMFKEHKEWSSDFTIGSIQYDFDNKE